MAVRQIVQQFLLFCRQWRGDWSLHSQLFLGRNAQEVKLRVTTYTLLLVFLGWEQAAAPSCQALVGEAGSERKLANGDDESLRICLQAWLRTILED